MFDVGFQELTLIGLIALIVVGPERLPRMARTLGLWMGKIRYYVGQVKSDIDREVRAQELREMLDRPARELDELKSVAEETKSTLDQAKDVLGEAKTALDAPPAGVSSANEPAAGSIFPTELPDAGSAQGPPAPSALPETDAGATADDTAMTAGSEQPARSEPEATPSGAPDSSAVATPPPDSDERSSDRV